MAKIKSAFEKAMEKAAAIGKLTPEEKQKLKDQESLRTLLAGFFKGDIDRDALWQKLKGSDASLLKQAQENMIDSIGLGGLHEEFQKRRDGILAIETLKDQQNTSTIELILDAINRIRSEYQEGRENAEEELKAAVESNPQMRLRPVRTPDGRTALQATLSVDEAVQERLSEFMSQHEEHYGAELEQMIMKLKNATL